MSTPPWQWPKINGKQAMFLGLVGLAGLLIGTGIALDTWNEQSSLPAYVIGISATLAALSYKRET